MSCCSCSCTLSTLSCSILQDPAWHSLHCQSAMIGGVVVYHYNGYRCSQHCLRLPTPVFSSLQYSRRQDMTVLCPTAEWCNYMIHQHHHCSYAPSGKLLHMATLNPSAQCWMTSVYPAAECCMTSAMLQLRRIVLRSLLQ